MSVAGSALLRDAVTRNTTSARVAAVEAIEAFDKILEAIRRAEQLTGRQIGVWVNPLEPLLKGNTDSLESCSVDTYKNDLATLRSQVEQCGFLDLVSIKNRVSRACSNSLSRSEMYVSAILRDESSKLTDIEHQIDTAKNKIALTEISEKHAGHNESSELLSIVGGLILALLLSFPVGFVVGILLSIFAQPILHDTTGSGFPYLQFARLFEATGLGALFKSTVPDDDQQLIFGILGMGCTVNIGILVILLLRRRAYNVASRAKTRRRNESAVTKLSSLEQTLTSVRCARDNATVALDHLRKQ